MADDDKPIDLAQERQNRDRLTQIGDLLANDPTLIQRTEAMLAGNLSAPDLEEPASVKADRESKKKEGQISLRLSPLLLKRADELVPHLQDDPRMLSWGGRVTRSSVIRLALIKGLEVLGQEANGLKRGDAP